MYKWKGRQKEQLMLGSVVCLSSPLWPCEGFCSERNIPCLSLLLPQASSGQSGSITQSPAWQRKLLGCRYRAKVHRFLCHPPSQVPFLKLGRSNIISKSQRGKGGGSASNSCIPLCP